MFRIPSAREVVALFSSAKTVASATRLIVGTASHLDAVASHHTIKADEKGAMAGEFRAAAADLDVEVVGHQKEAGTAARIASKLEALLS